MTVIEANVGEKIPYVVRGSKITFDDELMLNLAKLERDDPISVDICMTKLGMLTTGLGRDYVAQIAPVSTPKPRRRTPTTTRKTRPAARKSPSVTLCRSA